MEDLLWICNSCNEEFYSDESDPECPHCYSMDCTCCDLD